MNQYVRTKISTMQNVYATKKKKLDKTESFGAIQAKQRPANYDKLSPGEQWDIDKSLGILDWNGD